MLLTTAVATLAAFTALAATGCADGDSATVHDTPPTAESPDGASAPVTFTPEQLARLQVQPVALETFRPSLQTTGTVAFDSDISTQVLAPISGPVTRILVQPGAVVRAGQPLAIVSSPDFAAAVADVRKAQGAALQAERVAEQDEQLWKNDAIARRDLEQARTDAQSAAADRDAALQQLGALGVDRGTLDALREGRAVSAIQGAIRAPIGGTVVERLINPGQLLEAGATPCFTIADLSRMWVEASVFDSDLPFVHVGDRVDVATAASQPLHGTVTYIAALVDPSTKATAVRVEVPDPQHLLKRDMYVQATLHSSRERRGLLIPVAAVLRDEQNLPFVFVERTPAAGTPAAFARRPVTLGSRVGERYEIAGGLQPGERVITEGALFVQFAQSQCAALPSRPRRARRPTGVRRPASRRTVRRRRPTSGHRSSIASSPRRWGSGSSSSFSRRPSSASASGRSAGCRWMPIPISRHRWWSCPPSGPATPPRRWSD
jgi:cobalt-zinc-cadmium efflux system membrane fusion protein